ncbi:hypothetical protein IE4872_CH01208 [Rhizobium gallicum]|uniref:Uncharacterized protein n=1 Tax=Rhizobium gallicum TaxID=56730 RepID=A0A1L5NG25_9HYPH|nr:hypothetical protein IE4872_CH01208 [Rhizobium gallicum]
MGLCGAESLGVSTFSLICVLVIEIQPQRFRAVNDVLFECVSPALKDLGALDSCDRQRNEESMGWALAAKARIQRIHAAKAAALRLRLRAPQDEGRAAGASDQPLS